MGKRKVTHYTEDFKKSSAQLAHDSDKPITETARDLGINSTTLHGWVKKYYPLAKSKKSPQTDSDSELVKEVKQLRKENIRLKQERDILKKAIAIFSRKK